MTQQENERMSFLTEHLAERETMLSDVQKIKYIELYESLRANVVSIYNLLFDANFQMREAEKHEKKSKGYWSFFFTSTVFMGFLFYFNQANDAWSVGIAFAQLLLTSYFLLLISESNHEKSLAFQSYQLLTSKASRIENNLKFYGERYESSKFVKKFIDEIKANQSMPFHEFEDATDILEIKSEIAEFVWLKY
jgi:hypothetical protein